jgi:hypothetical protein
MINNMNYSHGAYINKKQTRSTKCSLITPRKYATCHSIGKLLQDGRAPKLHQEGTWFIAFLNDIICQEN